MIPVSSQESRQQASDTARDVPLTYGCEACAMRFRSTRRVINHYWRVHGLAVFFCQKNGCNRFFVDLWDKLIHEDSHAIGQRTVTRRP